MRLLFEIDENDYGGCTHTFTRDSARSIIIRNGKIAMIHSLKYDYYKFPGGGKENGEDPIQAMIRETREEAGLEVVPDTIKEYGFVHRIQKSDYDPAECFVQDNYYYLCDAVGGLVSQDLDDYEKQESYHLEFIEPALAIEKNRRVKESPYNRIMFEREARVIEMLISEGLIGSQEFDRMIIKEPIYIVAGDEMQKLMERKFPELKTIPFREDLSKGPHEGYMFSRDLIKNRASFWNVSEDEYSDKIAPIIDLDLSENYILCFGEDDCCRANLEFLIGYLKGRGYSGTIQVKIVNEYDLTEIREYTV